MRRLPKTRRPKVERLYRRDRLHRALDDCVAKPATWLAGPAGAGKTCLVAGYLDGQERPCVWLHLDPDDAEPATFFHYLKHAAQDVKRRLRVPNLLPEYRSRLDTFSRRYFRKLFEEVPAGTLFVLDNYEALPESSELHDLLARVMLETPADMSWIVLSRAEPPAAFARARVAGKLAYLGWDTLRFTLDESRELVRLFAGEQVVDSDWIDWLYDASQGWAAGVVLAVESTKTVGATQRTPHGFEALFDYFAAEIFQGLSPTAQELLMRTSCLSELTARDACELAGHDDAGAVLESFVKRNYFTFRLPRGSWAGGREDNYRYHPLFRHFLVEQAARRLSDETRRKLKQRAAELCADSGRLEQAVQLLLELGEWSRLAEWIPRAAPALIEQGRHGVLSAWLAQVPESLPDRSRGWLLYWKATASVPFDPNVAYVIYTRAFEAFGSARDGDGVFLAWAGAVEALFYGWGSFHPFDHWIDALERILEAMSPSSLAIEGRVTGVLFGAMTFRRPSDPSFEHWEKRVRRFLYMTRVLDTNHYVMLAIQVFHNDLWRGRVAKARALLDSLDGPVRSKNASPIAVLAWFTMRALYGHFTGDGEESVRAADEGLAFAEQSGVHFWDFLLLAQGAFGKLVRSDVSGARDYIVRMHAALHPERHLENMCYLDALAQTALADGKPAEALAYSKGAVDAAVRMGTLFAEATLRVGTSVAHFECKQYDAAGAELARAEALAEITGSLVLSARCRLARAEYALATGDRRTAETHLAQAFRVCREQGYHGLPWWRHEAMRDLCELALCAGVEREFSRTLVKKWGFLPSARGRALAEWPFRVKVFCLRRQLKVLIDERPLSFDSKAQRKPLELLQALIAFGGRDVGEQRLAEALWPDSEADAAEQALSTTLHRLRRLLGASAVRRADQKLTLERNECWVDCLACEALWEGETGDGTADRSLELYRGAFLQDCDAPWAEFYRQRLATKFVRFVERRAGTLDFPRAVELYERAVEAEPTSEFLYRSLIALLRDHGATARAADVYRQCCKNLESSFGCGPSSETRRVAQAKATQGVGSVSGHEPG